jgi:hypothetical protein
MLKFHRIICAAICGLTLFLGSGVYLHALSPCLDVETAPGTAGTGTILTVEPEKSPVGEYITLTVRKNKFDFSKAQFYVCLRKQVVNGENKPPFIPSADVELKSVRIGKAVLQAKIPAKIIAEKKNSVHCAKNVDLLVVASIPNEETVSVMSRQFKISSRSLATICWIIAFVLPWLIAGFFMGAPDEKNRSRFSLIRFVSGKYGGASISLAQILLWSILVFSASFYVLVVSGKLLDLTPEVLTLLGIAGGSSIIAKITASAREDKGREILGEKARVPCWSDLFKTEGRPDLYKVQLALFTTLAAFFVTGKIYGTLEFPQLPSGLLTLIGISNGVYLGAKATSKTLLEKLAEKDKELKEAVATLEKPKGTGEAGNENTGADDATDPTGILTESRIKVLEKELKDLKDEALRQI